MRAPVDCIVIGAGINGLTAAAYLARSGRRVLVLERLAELGGYARKVELAPGFRIDAGAHDLGWIPPRVVRELELRRHGVELLQPEPSVFAPLPGGGHLSLGRDRVASVESIRRHSAPDAAKWPAFCDRVARLAGFLEHLYSVPVPDVSGATVAELMSLLALGRRLRGLGRSEMMELLRTLPMAVAELLDDWFESDALKGTVGASGTMGILQGPRSSGTAFVMLHRHVGMGTAPPRTRCVVRGGTGRLAQALAAAARALGAEVRTAAEVASIDVRDGRATGVVLSGGERIAARNIVSSVDARQTLLRLAGPACLDPEVVRAAQHIKFRGAMARVNLALGELPRFAASPGNDALLHGAISIAPSLEYLERAYDDAKYGGVSRRPYLEARIPSLHDPSLAPVGRHVMSVVVQHVPYRLRDGAWDDVRREALGDLVVRTLAEYAPALPGAIVARQVLTPRDLEQEFGLTEGNITQGELTLDQILIARPIPGWARYRTPIDGLYLCGVGTHPGNAGSPGLLAAEEILRNPKGPLARPGRAAAEPAAAS